MRKLIVFNHVSLDGYFVDCKGDMSWAKADHQDAEWDAFVAGNASGSALSDAEIQALYARGRPSR